MCLNVYAEDASRVRQDANNERRIAQGGYSSRQFEELLQNATDAAAKGGGRVEVYLSDTTLYVANDGEPFTERGIRSVLASDISAKDDEQIGKFGIGFKSILAVSDTPKVFSRTVSFGFDRMWSTELLQSRGYDEDHYPVMRLARVLDPQGDGAHADPVLAELMDWASTVVVATLNTDVTPLASRLAQFPSEFVLFSPHLKTVRMRSNVTGPDGQPSIMAGDRTIARQDRGDGFVTVVSGTGSTTWSLVTKKVAVSRAAYAEAGHVAARQSVEVQYAVQFPPSKSDGAFWAYFPTETKTTLSGIVNAPWKLSDDRRHLLDSSFNRELLEVLPQLVGSALIRFGGTDQAVSILDALPSRGGELGAKEARNWADEEINGPIFSHMRKVACVPNAAGDLRKPKELQWVGNMGASGWLDRWAATASAPLDHWVAGAAYAPEERRLKVSRLMGAGAAIEDSAAGLSEWLEALVASETVDASADAILLAEHVFADDAGIEEFTRRRRGQDAKALQREVQAQVRAAKIVRLEDGSLSAPAKGRVFVRVAGDDSSDVAFVDRDLAKRPGIPDALGVLGVKLMDLSGELRKLLHRWNASAKSPADAAIWSEIWRVMRQLSPRSIDDILHEDLPGEFVRSGRVKSAAGRWVRVCDAFIGGRLVPADGSRDPGFLIDPKFHSHDDELLQHFGAVEVPLSRSGKLGEPWLEEWAEMARQAFVDNTRFVDPKKAEISMPASVTWPLQPVTLMSAEAKRIVTELLLRRTLPPPVRVANRGESVTVVGPETFFLWRNAHFATSHGTLRPSDTVVPLEGVRPEVFPTVDIAPSAASMLGVKASLEELGGESWRRMKHVVDNWRSPDRDADRSHFYAWSLYHGPADLLTNSPPVVAVGNSRQPVEVQNVGVTSSSTTYDSLLDAGIPALLVEEPTDLDEFVRKLEMPLGEDLLQEEVIVEPSGELVHLTDEFPPLKIRLQTADQDLKLQPASRIERMTATPKGQVAKRLAFRRESGTLFVTGESARDRLAQVSEALGLDLGREGVDQVLASMAKAATDKLRTQVKRCKDHNERLVLAAGVEALRRAVPAQALTVLEQATGEASPTQVAALAQAVHGVGILKVLSPALEENGLMPPREWTGRRLPRQWVDGLGFPGDWAGFPGSQRAAVEVVDGPAVLSPLHAYQKVVTERIEELLRGVGPDRGMVSLPTGAGKTRVTVEALVQAVALELVAPDKPLVWIAQTDELCEQAAETWTYVWRAIGPQVPMRLGRLWGSNEVPEEPGAFQLVIATVQKLSSLQKRGEEYDWLRDPSIVVIDEAHTSIATSYTQVLDWMGRGGRGRDRDIRRPLLGLTATPFRGTSEVDTDRLVGRYDGNRLDQGAFRKEDPYEELQDMGVLAQVRHEVLDGIDVTLSAQDKAEIEKTRKLPSTVSERLGSDLERTKRVVDHIASLPDDWTVIAFAPSVENARVVAALLAQRGVPAVSVSSDTEPAVRRHYVEEFKAGRIRVITNYNVLTQGFDAPQVRAVYVARPTFSPNVYQQMIGRGLRGPLNGGSEEVLIVNVEDNFDQYGDLLAFNEFEYLWTKR
ncbi:sacsin N-terminal ATP-binding-like domain-containing protein [Nocardioides exalbidus]|uniref:sacsin N-terminal ATP-binding-like domain-containing protein n=1 Tax=Nocardioides exalbidus TaxID=402596 RepID=UPI000B82963C|nr:DEAD/DEAH box helicase family protein [Nocardioides exalbidus]